MVCCRPRHVESPCGNLGPGVFVFVVRPDQEEIGVIVAQQIGVHLGRKKESESRIYCFYNDEFISRRDVEHLGLR